MNKLEILVICRHPEILQTVIRLVNNNPEWNATGAETDEDAIAAFNSNDCKLVLLGAGVDSGSEEKLKDSFLRRNPDTIFVQHYGGGSGLLSAEIYEALAGRI
jgi:hypothetical protein